jgi:ATP-dependent Lon protease
VSLFTDRTIRSDVAMTGEITLRGKVLPVGGVKEKLLAAHRARIKTVILPEQNKKDTLDLPPKIRKQLKLTFVENMDQVIRAAFRSGTRKQTKKAVRKKTVRKRTSAKN